MCGRFTLTVDPAEAKELYENASFPGKFAPRFNIAPSQAVLAIPNDGKRAADFFLWGLIPSWSKDASIGSRLINARSETLAEKPSYRGAYKYKRCLIPADGFYEWKSQPGTKTKVPYFIHLKDSTPFAFAGLWDEWRAADGSGLRTCTIITTSPNQLMAPIHDRMPAILRREDYAHWLDQSPRSPDSLNHLIAPYPADQMEAYPVSALVNSPSNDRAELLQHA